MKESSRPDALERQLLSAWRRHNEILLLLFDNVLSEGFSAVPLASRGRDVASQFAHLHRVRLGWLEYHATGKRPKLPGCDKTSPPSTDELRQSLAESGERVEEFLARAFRGEEKIRMFGQQPVRWMAYLISHESHHRGQIMLALKQAGEKVPDKIALQGLWGKWIYGG
ncbi:MAG: DinB family protein [Acidobacteriota bacterium]|nr:DinB family protein [Acidobacteriota bacterium]